MLALVFAGQSEYSEDPWKTRVQLAGSISCVLSGLSLLAYQDVPTTA